MGLRHGLYSLVRQTITFPQNEKYYREILERGEELPDRYLAAMLDYVRRHVPYYSSVELDKIPIITKAQVRRNFERLKSDELGKRKWYFNSSGGSTGRPQTFVQDKTFQQWSMASQNYFYRQFLGMDYAKTPKVVLWGSERDILSWSAGVKPRLSNWLTQTTFLNTFKMSKEDIFCYIDVINSKKPEFVKGYAGSLYELAAAARARGTRLHAPRIVYSSAERLTPMMRETIEDAFGCKVHDFYGSREVGTIAGECRRGKMHVFSFNNMVEVVDDEGKPVPPGEEGRVIVTTLHNYSMPLIRYEIGDTAVAGGGCDCGSWLPVVERITGRVTDHFVTEDGDIVHGEYFTHLFYFRDWVEEFQVLQTDVARVEVYFVSEGDADPADVDDITRKIRAVMGEGCAVEWKRVQEIPRTPQGKMLYTRSLVSKGEGQ